MTGDREAAGLRLTDVTALCRGASHINPSLVLVQPRKTRPYITERLFMGRKESYQTNKMASVDWDGKNQNKHKLPAHQLKLV